MYQIPTRLAIWLILALVGIAFLVGVFYWNKDSYKCIEGKKPYGEWVTVMAVSKFEIRVKPWGCTEAQRYDPKQFKPLY